MGRALPLDMLSSAMASDKPGAQGRECQPIWSAYSKALQMYVLTNSFWSLTLESQEEDQERPLRSITFAVKKGSCQTATQT